MATVYIYRLRDPRNGAVRYVGKTINPRQRKINHSSPSIEHGRRKNRWVAELRALSLRPQFEIIEECNEENWPERERFWIAHYGGIRNLLNSRLGGEVIPPRSEESYRIEAEKRRGVRRPPEVGRKVSEALKGRIVSDSTKEKLREANKIQFSDPVSAERHSQAVKNWQASLSPEVKANTLKGLDAGRNLGPVAMKEKWDSMTESERQEWSNRMHDWINDPSRREEFLAHQAKAVAKRWENPEAHIVGPQKEEHKQAIKSSMKSFWSTKTPAERSAIARSNWEKRRAKAAQCQ